jgi:hypothetical protein
MKTGTLFWGGFLLSSGCVLLLGNYDLVDFGNFEWFKITPVALILIGIAVLFPKDNVKAVIAILSGIFLGTTIFAGIQSSTDSCTWEIHNKNKRHHSFNKMNYTIESDSSISQAEASISMGVGELIINGGNDFLFSAATKSNISNFSLTDTTINGKRTLWFEPKEKNISLSGFQGNHNEATIQLSNSILWKLNLDIGAADADIDVSNIKVESLDIDAGVADVDIKIGELQENIKITYDGGASSVRLHIPKNLGCEIHIQQALSDINFDNFTETSEGIYQSDNYGKATKRALVSFDVGVSDVEVVRY